MSSSLSSAVILPHIPSPLVNLIGEYLPLPEHRRFQELCPADLKEYFTTDAIETLLNNLEMLIETVGRFDANEEWVEVFRGERSYSPQRAIGCVMWQNWFWRDYLPFQPDKTTILWKGVPFFTWKNIKQLAAKANPPLPVTIVDGRIALKQYGLPDLSDEQAEKMLQAECSIVEFEESEYN